MEHGTKLITQAEYARRRSLPKSSLSRWVQRGQVPTHGGLINPAEADEARRGNIDPRRGRRKEVEPRVDDSEHDPYRMGQLDAVDQLQRPEKMLVAAEAALAVGCDLRQAILVAWWYAFLVRIWIADEDEAVKVYPDPDWSALATRVGQKVTPAEIKRWLKASGSLVDKWDAAHPRPTEKPQPAARKGLT